MGKGSDAGPADKTSNNDHVAVVTTHTAAPLVQLTTKSKVGVDKEKLARFFQNDVEVGAFETNKAGMQITSSCGDFAEWHEKVVPSEFLPEGTVVGFDHGKVQLCTTNAHLLGVVSERALIVGSMGFEELRKDGVVVAYCGRVPIRVIGPVAAGDVLIPSGSSDGVARVSTIHRDITSCEGPSIPKPRLGLCGAHS